MCGRFSLGVNTDDLVAAFDIASVADGHQPRYNIAPNQRVAAVVRGDDGLRLGSLRWGLVPHWADDPGIGARMINARSETVDRKPAFRDAFAARRCWVLADGFYEWRQQDGVKIPIYFHLPDRRPFAFAGLWDRWTGGGDAITSCTILTTEPNDAVRPVHDRMPVLLEEDRRGAWLDPDASPHDLKALLRPFAGTLEHHPVSTRVNRPENDDPSLVEPVGRSN